MRKPNFFLFFIAVILQITLSAQVQWYQNQNGNNPLPNGTVGTSIQSFTPSSFIATYLWNTSNDQYTWKISKSHINGTEQRQFFITGPSSQAEAKIGQRNTVYVLERSFPFGQNAHYTIYKLDSNLNVSKQKNIILPNDFSIFNLNAFELDKADNLYLAGDGQYPDGPGFKPASFVLKTDKDLNIQWRKMDSTQTSFTGIHIDSHGTVLVVEDFYTFFPEVRIKKINANGQYANTLIVQTDPGRLNLYSVLDKDDNLFLYGSKSVTNNTQGVFLSKISVRTGRVVYNKTYFIAPGTQLNDLRLDEQGNIFSLVYQYAGPGNELYKVSRIHSSNGTVYWNRSFPFARDSCNLLKLVTDQHDKLYIIGARMSHTYFSKGFALRMKKNGQTERDNYTAPDSVRFQRSHWLVDGITDRNAQLIAIGNTNDLDTATNSSTYLRSFAIRFGNRRHHHGHHDHNDYDRYADEEADTEPLAPAQAIVANKATIQAVTDDAVLNTKLVIFPNPVQDQLRITNLNPGEYDKLSIYTLQGVLLAQQTIHGASAGVNVSALKAGMYLLVLKSSVNSHQSSTKFLIQR